MSNPEVFKAWQARLDGYARSGLTIRKWCAQEGVSCKQFRYWRARMTAATQGAGSHEAAALPAQPNGSAQWLSVEIAGAQVAAAPRGAGATHGVSIRIAGARIEVERGFDPAMLRAVVGALAVERCL